MQKLTKAEEEIMQIIWKIGPCTVRDIREFIAKETGEDLPPHSSISTIVRGLDNQEGNKSFLGFKAYGRTYEYAPIISKEEYGEYKLKNFVDSYFEGSMNSLVSFLVKKDDLSVNDLNDLINRLEDDNS